jgi:hypothetical protein
MRSRLFLRTMGLSLSLSSLLSTPILSPQCRNTFCNIQHIHSCTDIVGLAILWAECVQCQMYLPNKELKLTYIADVRFWVFTAVTKKNVIFWDVTPCGSCKNRRFGGTYRLHHQGDKNQGARNVSSVAGFSCWLLLMLFLAR